MPRNRAFAALPLTVIPFVLAVALTGCGAPTGGANPATSVPAETSTPTPEVAAWDGCPDGIADDLAAGFAAQASTKLVAVGSTSDITNPVVAPLLPTTACVLNFTYSDAANVWTVIIAPDDGLAISSPLNTTAKAAGYGVTDYGTFITYLDAANGSTFDVSTAGSGADLADPYLDVVGADLFPDYAGSLIAIRIVTA